MLSGSSALLAQEQKQYVPFAFSKENTAIQKMCSSVDELGWLYFAPEAAFTAKDFLSQNKAALGFGRDDAMQAGSEYKDEYGSSYWFHHYYKGIPVEGSEFMLMEKQDKLHLIHAKFVEKLNIDVTTKIDEKVALTNALSALQITDKDYKFNSPSREVIKYKVVNDLNPNNYFHCYRFDIQNLKDKTPYTVYINAKTGEVLQKFSNIHHCNHTETKTKKEDIGVPYSTNSSFSVVCTPPPPCATATEGHTWTMYNGYQGITTSDRIAGWYELFDGTRGIKSWDNGIMRNINSCTNEWSTYLEATSALYAAQTTYGYYDQRHDRPYPREGNDFKRTTAFYNPLDIDVIPLPPPPNEGTGYDPNSHGITIYKPAGSNVENTVDIVGHEITHGVMIRICDPGAVIPTYEDRPVYQGEAGALNESFADIFGTCTEHFVGTETFDWTMGENTGVIKRSLSNPLLYTDPNTYNGLYWASTTGGDYGGVHTNSGVQNRWFYLLAQGGTQNGVTVSGIGIINAAKIAYRNMANYAQHQWSYADARTGSINAANDIFGACSLQSNQVRNAWKAVGVGDNTENCPKITINGTNRVIIIGSLPAYNTTATYTVSTTPSVVDYLSHNAPSGWSVVKNGNNYTVNTNGVSGSLTVTAIKSGSQASASRSIMYSCPGCRPNIDQGIVDLDNQSGTTNAMKLNLSPNPSQGVLNINIEGVSDETNSSKYVKIFDLQGKKVYETTFLGENTALSVENLINGMYILQINTASQSTVGKFIINK
jgi:Zn-dependent metalloprotease